MTRPIARPLPHSAAPSVAPRALARRLNALRDELAELAYLLDTWGRRDAADVTMMISARLAEICDAPGARPPGEVRFDSEPSQDN